MAGMGLDQKLPEPPSWMEWVVVIGFVGLGLSLVIYACISQQI